MIAALQIEKMTRSEKLQVMELLWDNLSSNEQETGLLHGTGMSCVKQKPVLHLAKNRQ
jgi:hypothetical protein